MFVVDNGALYIVQPPKGTEFYHKLWFFNPMSQTFDINLTKLIVSNIEGLQTFVFRRLGSRKSEFLTITQFL